MLTILGYAALGYALITATMLVGFGAFFIPVILMEAATDPAGAKKLAKEVPFEFLPVAFGWPLAPILMAVGAVPLVTR